jgi:DNA-binding NtrC family response regulator
MLVIDDDRAILKVFTRIFEKRGYSVSTAETGREAEKKLAEKNYDATLLDIRLPDMDGTDLLPLMQEIAPNMVKIVITGLAEAENYHEAGRKGADVFLSKPVEPEILLDVLDRKLKEKKA